MCSYKKYSIKDTDVFDCQDFPQIVRELEAIKDITATLPDGYKIEIIISFLKNHSIRKTWIQANQPLVDLITSGSLPISNMEVLFESCKRNPGFLHAYEAYITKQIA